MSIQRIIYLVAGTFVLTGFCPLDKILIKAGVGQGAKCC